MLLSVFVKVTCWVQLGLLACALVQDYLLDHGQLTNAYTPEGTWELPIASQLRGEVAWVFPASTLESWPAKSRAGSYSCFEFMCSEHAMSSRQFPGLFSLGSFLPLFLNVIWAFVLAGAIEILWLGPSTQQVLLLSAKLVNILGS